MSASWVIYYDFEPGLGVNAYFPDFGHEYFSTIHAFRSFCDIEYDGVDVVEITNENYKELCAQGVFDDCL